MTALTVEHFRVPSSRRGVDAFEFARSRAADALGGRTVWCATALPTGGEAADAMRARLRRAGVAAGRLELAAGDRPAQLAQRLDAMLRSEHVGADDVVVLHDSLTAALAEAVREWGAHAVWYVAVSAAPRGLPAVDAYVTAAQLRGRRGTTVEGIVAFMPSAGLVSAKRVESPPEAPDTRLSDVGWSTMLADIVGVDRGETVGGTLHPRPAVPGR